MMCKYFQKAKLDIRHTNDKSIKVELAVAYWGCIRKCPYNVGSYNLVSIRERNPSLQPLLSAALKQSRYS